MATTNGTELHHWKQLANPNYIGAYSLQPGEERVVEIIKVVQEIVSGPDGKKDDCIVAYLKNEKPMILNATNCKTLSKLYNSPFIENWIGKQMIIYAKKIRAFGEEVEALRIKDTVPALPELSPSHAKWNEALTAIQDGKTTIEKVMTRYFISEPNKKLLQTPVTA